MSNSSKFCQLGKRSKAFKLIISKINESLIVDELLWKQMDEETECSMGTTDCLDMTKKLLMK